MNPRPTAVLTEAQVIEILNRLDTGEFQHLIAASYGVSTKTISRIKTGETWSEITQRYRVRDRLAGAKLPIVQITPLPTATIDLLDEVIAIKNHFGFSFDHPIHWGWFDAWDGLHSVVSDGIILWESADLVNYAQKLTSCGVNDHPIWAQSAEEMPTFDIEDIMTMPVGEKFKPDMEADGAVKLICGSVSIFLHSKFVNIARRLKLDIRVAGQSEEFVYLTKLKPKSPADPTHIVIACVATMSV
jgi:hypothetical protein